MEYNVAIDYNDAEPVLVGENYLANAVDQLLEGSQVKQPFTRAIGCKFNFIKQQ